MYSILLLQFLVCVIPRYRNRRGLHIISKYSSVERKFDIRLFLFQTLLASGPLADPVPLARLDLALKPPSADFATNLGLRAELAGDD
jgi:hypothetical protein